MKTPLGLKKEIRKGVPLKDKLYSGNDGRSDWWQVFVKGFCVVVDTEHRGLLKKQRAVDQELAQVQQELAQVDRAHLIADLEEGLLDEDGEPLRLKDEEVLKHMGRCISMAVKRAAMLSQVLGLSEVVDKDAITRSVFDVLLTEPQFRVFKGIVERYSSEANTTQSAPIPPYQGASGLMFSQGAANMGESEAFGNSSDATLSLGST